MRHGLARLPRAGLTIMVVALTLLLSACNGAAANSSPQQASAPKTATPTSPPAHLNWRKITMPANLTPGQSGVAMDVSPVNGRVAWTCAPSSGGRYLIWRTQDAGATWSQMSALAPAAPQPITGCSLTADQNRESGVVAWFLTSSSSNNSPGSQGALAYYSADGGASWVEMPQNWWIKQVATSGDATYALVLDLAHGGGGSSAMFASSDQLKTWQAINPTSQAMEQNTQFWAPADSGELLFSLNYTNQLYHSTDNGLHWTQTLAQTGQPVAVQLAAWRGQAAGWLVCGDALNGPSTQTLCSQDLGKTWTARKNLQSAQGCANCADGYTRPCDPTAVAADGTLYAICGSYHPPTDIVTTWVLSRLPLGASTWTTVGQAPGSLMTMTQTGQVWCADDANITYVLDQLP